MIKQVNYDNDHYYDAPFGKDCCDGCEAEINSTTSNKNDGYCDKCIAESKDDWQECSGCGVEIDSYECTSGEGFCYECNLVNEGREAL